MGKSGWAIRTTLLMVGGVLTVMATALASPAHAATLNVNSLDDGMASDGHCTLRKAIISANTDTATGGTVASTCETIDKFRAIDTTAIIVDHRGKLQVGESYQSKIPYGSAYKKHLGSSVFQVEASEGAPDGFVR